MFPVTTSRGHLDPQVLSKSCTTLGTVLKAWQNSGKKLSYEENFTGQGYLPEDVQPAPITIFCLMRNVWTWYCLQCRKRNSKMRNRYTIQNCWTPQLRSRYRGIFSQARTENSRSFFHVHWVPLFFRFMWKFGKTGNFVRAKEKTSQ